MKFDEHGLIPAIVQDAQTHEVLTLAYMNEESLRQTLQSGETWFWSRSRNELWHKGATSGNTQLVRELVSDCDNDAVLVQVNPIGPACHTGKTSCFHNPIEFRPFPEELITSSHIVMSDRLQRLYEVIENRRRNRPKGSYTAYLFDEGLDKILKKLGEEASETIIAAKNDDDSQFVSETADLLYHLLVLCVAKGITLEQIGAELDRRATQNAKTE